MNNTIAITVKVPTLNSFEIFLNTGFEMINKFTTKTKS